ncbi:MAG: hypothetical protein ACON4Z_07775 [Planctomycetota bacterium]
MSTLQFALFFVAVLAGYVLVHLRLIRFEEHLRHLQRLTDVDDRLKALDERCQALAAAVAPEERARLAAQLDRLHEDLEDLGERARTLGEAAVQIPAMRPASSSGAGATQEDAAGDRTPAAQIVSRIEARLLQLGYRNLRLLGDLRGVEVSDEVEVQVEAERNGMPCKGRIVVHNGSVSDLHMQTVAQSFP